MRGRVGILTTPAIVAYATGGLAYGQISTNGTIAGQTGGGAVTASSFNGGATDAGWTAGVGVGGLLSGQWTCKVEYLYMDIGKVDTAGSLPKSFIPVNVAIASHLTDNIIRAGANYRF